MCLREISNSFGRHLLVICDFLVWSMRVYFHESEKYSNLNKNSKNLKLGKSLNRRAQHRVGLSLGQQRAQTKNEAGHSWRQWHVQLALGQEKLEAGDLFESICFLAQLEIDLKRNELSMDVDREMSGSWADTISLNLAREWSYFVLKRNMIIYSHLCYVRDFSLFYLLVNTEG